MGTTLMLGSFHRRSFLKSDQSHTAAQPPPSRWRDLVGGGLLWATPRLCLGEMTASLPGCRSAGLVGGRPPPFCPWSVPPPTLSPSPQSVRRGWGAARRSPPP